MRIIQSLLICYLTEDIDCSEFSNLKIEKHIYPASLGEQLSQEFKPTFYENRGKFDYYIYYEDDVLMTKEVFNTFVSIQDTLSLPYVCGFLRYELKEGEDYKYLIDNHPKHSCHRGGKTIIKSNHIINGEPYLEVYNIHHGGHVLTKEALDYITRNNSVYFQKIGHYAGVREGCGY